MTQEVPHQPIKSPIKNITTQLLDQYRNSRKEWKKPSSTFTSVTPRIPPSREALQSDAKSLNGTLAYEVKKSKKNSAVGFIGNHRLRPESPKVLCDVMYDPKISATEPKRHATLRWNASLTPRLIPTPQLYHGQHMFYDTPTSRTTAASSSPTSARHATSSFISTTPRMIPTPKLAYNYNKKSDVNGVSKKNVAVTSVSVLEKKMWQTKQTSNWSKHTSQRVPIINKSHDLNYSPKNLEEIRYFTRTPQLSLLERFPVAKSVAPPVGTYTSPFIACGMMA